MARTITPLQLADISLEVMQSRGVEIWAASVELEPENVPYPPNTRPSVECLPDYEAALATFIQETIDPPE
jgi:hypothetical protein